MNNLLLFPGAVVRLRKTNLIFSMDRSTFVDNVVMRDIDPVPITPELLTRLEGQNGERFERQPNGNYRLPLPGWVRPDAAVKLQFYKIDIYYASPYGGQAPILNISDLQARVLIDTGIMLNLI